MQIEITSIWSYDRRARVYVCVEALNHRKWLNLIGATGRRRRRKRRKRRWWWWWWVIVSFGNKLVEKTDPTETFFVTLHALAWESREGAKKEPTMANLDERCMASASVGWWFFLLKPSARPACNRSRYVRSKWRCWRRMLCLQRQIPPRSREESQKCGALKLWLHWKKRFCCIDWPKRKRKYRARAEPSFGTSFGDLV